MKTILIWTVSLSGTLVAYPQMVLEAISDFDFCIQGFQVNERVGQQVAIGDINGDSLEDLIVCSRFYDIPPNRIRAGAIYIIFGRSSPPLSGTLLLNQPSSADLAILGAKADDRLGMSYESTMPPVGIGDLNGDEISDLIVSAPNASPLDRSRAGTVYIYYGQQNFPAQVDLSIDSADLTILGVTPSSHLGSTIEVGDLDNDGMDDLILGSPLFQRGSNYPFGRIDILAGATVRGATSVLDLSLQPSDWTILGASEQEELGDSIAIGDANGDGIDDLLIGVPGAQVIAYDSRGKAYLFFGGSNRLGGEITDLRIASADCTILGENQNDRFGHSVEFLQISPGPGQALVIGSPFATPSSGDPEEDRTRFDWGGVYIFESHTNLPQLIDLSLEAADFTIYGTTNGDRIGFQVTGGHISSSIVEDLVIGGYSASRSPDLNNEGLVLICPVAELTLNSGQRISINEPARITEIWGGRESEYLCTSLAMGDIDGDNLEDLIVGAPISPGSEGRCYLFYGSNLRVAGLNSRFWMTY